jgi:hypothetical protein
MDPVSVHISFQVLAPSQTQVANLITSFVVRVRVRVTLRLTVYHQSVRFGDNPLRITTRNSFFQLNTCGHSPYIISFLTRGWVYHLKLLLVLASPVILRS